MYMNLFILQVMTIVLLLLFVTVEMCKQILQQFEEINN